MRRRNDGSDIGSTLARQWAEMRRQKKIDSMSRVLAYLFRFEGPEHEEPRAKVLTPEDWTLEGELRAEAPGILAKLIAGSPRTISRNPGIVPKDEHGLTADFIHTWLWANADERGRVV